MIHMFSRAYQNSFIDYWLAAVDRIFARHSYTPPTAPPACWAAAPAKAAHAA